MRFVGDIGLMPDQEEGGEIPARLLLVLDKDGGIIDTTKPDKCPAR